MLRHAPESQHLNMAISLYSPEIEQHVIGLILRHPDLFADISFIAEKDFGPVRQRIFSVIRQQLDSPTPGSIAPIILTEKLKSYGMTAIEGVDVFTYLDGLSNRGRMLDKTQIVQLAKELKKMTVKRELIDKCDEAKQKVMKADTLEEMTTAVDTTLNSVATEYYQPESTLMFEGFIDVMEGRRENPIKAEDMGFQGPFPSLNATLGSICFPSSFVTIGARTGGQKSALGFFYNISVAERYKIKVLHLDANEMPKNQILDRAACCFSKGKIPLWAVKSGEWGQNKEWVDMWRQEIAPKIRRLEPLIHYQNVGRMTPDQVVSYIKRFYYKHVGRGNHLLINLDYIKGAASFRGTAQEHQIIGDYIDNLKNLITNEITASMWTSVQLNRGGITSGKKLSDIVDSEANYALSDRIIQQSTDGFSMRFKIPEELANEKGLFGNIKLEHHKGRDLVGKQFQSALMPIKTAQGKFMKNYYNLDSRGFHFEDKGDLNHVLKTLGHVAIDLGDDRKAEDLP